MKIIMEIITLFQTWYFGLNYTDALNQNAWLVNEKKINKQKVRKSKFKVRNLNFIFFANPG